MFINDLPKRERIEIEIGALSAGYIARIEQRTMSAREMILGCREVLDLWIEGGGSSLDDEVIGVLGIESQCDHVMLRPGQRKPQFPEYDDDEESEINRLGAFFASSFEREMRDLHERFNRV